MQISGSSYYSGANSSGATREKTASPTVSFRDQRTDDGSAFSRGYNPLLETLLKVESVQKFVSVSDDGTYSFNWTIKDGGLNSQQMVARDLIDAANAWGSWTPPTASRYTQADLDLFHQATGYNLILTEEFGEMIVDDNGNAPAAGDMAKVNAAWELMASIGYARSSGAISGDISLDNFPDVLGRFGTTNLGEGIVRDMLADFMTTLGASAEDIANLQTTSYTSHEGEQINTWSWSPPTGTVKPVSFEATELAERLKYLLF